MSIGAVSGIGGGYNFTPVSEVREKMFNRMDQDGDGVISKAEFMNAAPDKAQKNGRALNAEEIFARIDTNQDGVIDKSEHEAAMEQMHQHPPRADAADDLSELLGKIFAAMDTNQDGVVDKSEYEAAMQQLGNQTDRATASAAATDTANSEVASTDAASASTTSTGENSLSALVAQFLDLLAMMEKGYSAQYSQESQNSQGMNSYA